MNRILFIGACLMVFTSNAEAAQKLHLSISNGGRMPISPPIVYSSTQTEAHAIVGSAPTAGFVKICQSGDASDRIKELKADASVKLVTQVEGGPIFPGETRDLVVELNDRDIQGLHVEAMYGKTKDTCAVASFTRHSLIALKQNVVKKVSIQDRVLVSGAYQDPNLESMYLRKSEPCQRANSAVECLRELSAANEGAKKIQVASTYLPSVLNFLENKYGPSDVQTLLIPSSGALTLGLQTAH